MLLLPISVGISHQAQWWSSEGLEEVTYGNNWSQIRPTSYYARLALYPLDGDYQYMCIPPFRRSCRTPHGMPEFISAWCCDFWRFKLTCRTFSARRISPLESFKSAAFPSSVRLHLSSVHDWGRGDDSRRHTPLALPPDRPFSQSPFLVMART
jgi:hypothetical protein